MVVAWNATPAQLEAAFAKMLPKAKREELARQAKAKADAILAKYGIPVVLGGRYSSQPSAPADKVLALLDAIDRALANKKVYAKKIDSIFLEMNNSGKKMTYLDESITPPQTRLPFQVTDSGFVSLNGRVTDPSEVAALLASDTISELPGEQTFADIDKLLGQTADPLLRQRLHQAKTDFSALRTPDRREMHRLVARIGRTSDVGFTGGLDDARAEVPLLRRIATLPADALRLPAATARTDFYLPEPYSLPGGIPNANQWQWGGGCYDYTKRCGWIKLSPDATAEQVKASLATIPSKAALDELVAELKKNKERATQALGQQGLKISEVEGQQMTFQQTRQQSRLLGQLATCARKVKLPGGEKPTSILFRIGPGDSGEKVWRDKNYTGAISIQVDATSADLGEFFEGCGVSG